jgi:3-deoxy-D-manno-octulosonate 8-phosphate phosphatase (KDO 8-P phosphatase)
MQIEEKARKIKAVIIDVDGVLTDGKMVYGNYGDELKFFDVQDGLGLQLLQEALIYTFIISGRFSKVTLKRARELKITKVYQNAGDKFKIYEKLKKKFKLKDDEICCIGDDIPDLPVMTRVGFACAVANAQEDVKRKAHYITEHSGGNGAVREVVNIILKSQDKWRELTRKYCK